MIGAHAMFRSLVVITAVALASVWPATFATAQFGFGIHVGDDHDDDHHHGHDDDHHHGHHDEHHHHHHDGFDIHFGDDHHFDPWDDHGHHVHHHHDLDWSFVVPHFDHHYHGSYYCDDGINYYIARPYIDDRRTYVAAQPVVIEFGGYSHVDDLAGRLERQSNELCLDLHHNYRHNPGFAATYREAYQILSTAKYIHAKEHQGARHEVARRVDELDGLLHHVQDDVNGWSRRHRRQIGQSNLQTKLTQVEATLHHLMNDVGVQGAHAAPPTAGVEVAPPPIN